AREAHGQPCYGVIPPARSHPASAASALDARPSLRSTQCFPPTARAVLLGERRDDRESSRRRHRVQRSRCPKRPLESQCAGGLQGGTPSGSITPLPSTRRSPTGSSA